LCRSATGPAAADSDDLAGDVAAGQHTRSRAGPFSLEEVEDFVTEVTGVLEQEGVPGVAVEDDFGVPTPRGTRPC
jgi:hypothetical protein